ncbi:MAG: hypothetical protein D0530_04870 [Methylococcales bacterium]|nr:MAG: hypothetical protein D0530_04870 [Methylococcales bacterium]
MAEVFQPLKIYSRTQGGTLIHWDLNPFFKAAQPYTFKVYVTDFAASQNFELAAVVLNNNFAIDTKQRTYSKDWDIQYRVDLVDNNNVVYSSRVASAQGQMSKQEYLLSRAIIQRETLWMTKFGGTCGFLWKRRQWGPVCTTCGDWDTQEATRGSNCSECFGVGITGGYYDPITFYVGQSQGGAPHHKKVTTENAGVEDNRARKARAIICPEMNTNDVWCNAVTDQRYIVGSVGYIDFKMCPIIQDPIELRLAPATDVVYNLVRPDEVISSSSSSSSSA